MTPRPTPGSEGIWRARPFLSSLVRAGIYAIPIAFALGTTWIVRSAVPSPSGLWWALLLTPGVLVAMIVERLTRRLTPLATLLKLSMLFPGRAPSRFRVARQAGNLRQLESLQTRDDDVGDSATKILALVTALSNHDRHTRGHAERVRVFTDMLSEELDLPEQDRYRLRWAALLHDIGKLSIAPDILNKPAKLDDREWAMIREHPAEGVRLTGALIVWLGPWGQAIAHHHERVDGTGYPAGLAGERISLGGRIVSVADAYDTMTSARSYQKPKATATARKELVACAGTQFDASIVRAFLAISLPRLLWATGPLSLVAHLPFLGQLQQIGQTSIAVATQTATATAVAGVTVMGLVGPSTVARADESVGGVRLMARVESSASMGRETTTPGVYGGYRELFVTDHPKPQGATSSPAPSSGTAGSIERSGQADPGGEIKIKVKVKDKDKGQGQGQG
ncbi:MAG: HD-GYP domain-containing protein, partial [Actinomycetota bacterium]|nr:HD-GYP domain-containing protein [Actinomycetota bacterium]